MITLIVHDDTIPATKSVDVHNLWESYGFTVEYQSYDDLTDPGSPVVFMPELDDDLFVGAILTFWDELAQPKAILDHQMWTLLRMGLADGTARGNTSCNIVDETSLLAGGLLTVDNPHAINDNLLERRGLTDANINLSGSDVNVVVTHNSQPEHFAWEVESGDVMPGGGTAPAYTCAWGIMATNIGTANLTASGEALLVGVAEVLEDRATVEPVEHTLTHTADTHLQKTSSLTHTTTFILTTENTLFNTADFILQKTFTHNHTADFHISTGISGHTIDFIVKFEGTGVLEHDVDFLVKSLDNILTHDSDFTLAIAPFLQHTADFILSREAAVIDHTADFISIIRRALTHTADVVFTYGPDIETEIGQGMPKWTTQEVNLSLPSITRELYRVPVYAQENGVAVDPTGYVVQFAVIAADDDGQPVEPSDSDWVAGSWETDDSIIPNLYYSQILLGEDGAIELTDGDYYVWWKLLASTEAPVRIVGRLNVT